MKIIVNILLTTIISLSFIACEDKKEFKDTLKIEKEKKVKLEKPKWERKLILTDERTEEWFEDSDYSEVAAFNVGNVYRKLKDYKKAEEWYLYSASIKKYANNFVNLGLTYESLKEYEKSVSSYKEAFSLGDSESANGLGILFEEQLKDYKEAEKWYKEAIKRNSTDALKNIGLFYHNKLKDDLRASAHYIALINIRYTKAEVLNLLKNKWKLSDETIKKGYELQLTMPGLPKRYTGGI